MGRYDANLTFLRPFSTFRQFVAVIALNAVIAAVMSTADSTVIGANNIFSVTWIKVRTNAHAAHAAQPELCQASRVLVFF